MKKVLIVEDQPEMRLLIKDQLAAKGFDVSEAKNGKEGLEAALKEHPDLILLDVLMPEMNGIEMAKKLHEDEWGKNAKLIIMTNFDSESKLRRELQNITFKYMIKTDVQIEEIVEEATRVLSLS